MGANFAKNEQTRTKGKINRARKKKRETEGGVRKAENVKIADTSIWHKKHPNFVSMVYLNAYPFKKPDAGFWLRPQ